MFYHQVMIGTTETIYWLSILALAYVSVLSLYAIMTAKNSIYTGSGDPTSMAQNLWKLVFSQSQIVFGVFGLTILVILVIESEVSADVIFPLIGTLIGYVMGRQFRDLPFIPQRNHNEASRARASTSKSTSTSSSTSTTPPPDH